MTAVVVICYLSVLQLVSGHRVVILSAMERVIRAKIAEIDEQLAVDVIQQSSAELTQSKACHFYMH